MTRSSIKVISLVILLSIFISFPKYSNFSFQKRLLTKVSSSSLDLINAVNSLRTSNGFPPYKINQTLMFVAQNHTDYQASIGSTTHLGADGSRPYQRALSAGYLVAGDLSLGGFFSENIIAGKNLSASDAVNSWQSDGPHLNTMLSSSLQDIGAGVTVIGDTIYYTIDVGLATSGGTFPTQAEGIYPTYNPVFISKILTSTPGLDGSIYHVVEIGETIWGISQVYKISPEVIIQTNSLGDSLIYVGDKLLIHQPYTPTATFPSPTSTPSQSKTPSTTPTLQSQNTNTMTSTPLNTTSKTSTNQDSILIIVVLLALLSTSLYTVLGKIRNNK